jgi:hypothetical protein
MTIEGSRDAIVSKATSSPSALLENIGALRRAATVASMRGLVSMR